MLANAFARDGHEVTVLGRRPAPTTRWRAIAWTPTALGAWATELEGADAVIKDSIQGAVNIAAPNPVPNGEFMRTLREEWGARFGLPAPAWLLEIGARVIQTETELILKSRRVIPGILTKGGFTFDFPGWREAARDLCERWRKTQ
jgi:NAD dependent epimerase/dehydratase family enzyme